MFLLNTSAVISIEKSRKREIKIIEKGNFFYGFLFFIGKRKAAMVDRMAKEWYHKGVV